MRYGKDPKTFRKYFDAHGGATGEIIAEKDPINLLMDATFFGRTYGILVCRANGRNLYWKEIGSEKIEYYGACIDVLAAAGFVRHRWEEGGSYAAPGAVCEHSGATVSVPSDPDDHPEAHEASEAAGGQRATDHCSHAHTGNTGRFHRLSRSMVRTVA